MTQTNTTPAMQAQIDYCLLMLTTEAMTPAQLIARGYAAAAVEKAKEGTE